MGIGHCIVSKCADVFYQEYLPPSVRWRYGSEPWREIIGADNYSSVSSYNLSANQRYKYVAADAMVSNGVFQGFGQTYRSSVSYQFNGIQEWYVAFKKMFRRSNGSADYLFKYGYPPFDTWDHYGNALPPAGFRSIVPTIWVLSEGIWSGIQLPSTFGWSMSGWEPANLATATTQCQFKVFKKGQQVYTETRAVCPQVEVLPTRLDPRIQRIEINKVPFLDRVDVIPTGIGRFSDPTGISNLATDGVIVKYPIPPECLNVYKNPNDQSFPVDGSPELLPYVVPANGFIQQICSYPGTPPPEYTVTCSCKCIKCPPNTCPITCGDAVCCYDRDGRAILTIPLTDACEDMTCGC